MKDLFLALRPSQWTKNAVVLAAFFFAFGDQSQNPDVANGLLTVILAAFLFCLVSSGIYVLNDIVDIEADRCHPVKRRRPIAAGRIPVSRAWALAASLTAVGLIGARLLSPPFATVAAAYVFMQLLYSFWLKQVALVDIFVIAGGFVLRAIAGAMALDVPISPWLLLCAFLLALFLALCKRRHEKIQVTDAPTESRESLEKYNRELLDHLITIAASATVVSYAVYTMSAQTIEKFGTAKLGFTIPFVIFGIFRYLDLAYRRERVDRPEKILLTDLPILIDLILYAACVVAIFITQ